MSVQLHKLIVCVCVCMYNCNRSDDCVSLFLRMFIILWSLYSVHTQCVSNSVLFPPTCLLVPYHPTNALHGAVGFYVIPRRMGNC